MTLPMVPECCLGFRTSWLGVQVAGSLAWRSPRIRISGHRTRNWASGYDFWLPDSLYGLRITFTLPEELQRHLN